MRNRITYETILACKEGDSAALYSVIEFYASLITAASQKTIVDSKGKEIVIVDEDIKNYIEEQLMLRIFLKYNPHRKPKGKTKKDHSAEKNNDL